MELSNKEKGPEFYTGKDEIGPKHFEYRKPRLYDPAADFLPPPYDCPTIVDLGCGVGYFARILFERGYKRYIGVDFSKAVLRIAIEQTPQFEFWCSNLKSTELWETLKECEIFVCFEVLEHIKEDLKVLGNLPVGATIIFSVPNIRDTDHVRYFQTMDEVIERYKSVIDVLSNQVVHYKRHSRRFLVHGIMKG